MRPARFLEAKNRLVKSWQFIRSCLWHQGVGSKQRAQGERSPRNPSQPRDKWVGGGGDALGRRKCVSSTTLGDRESF